MIWPPRRKIALPSRQRGFFTLPGGMGAASPGGGGGGPAIDPYFANVRALLNFTGPDGGTSFFDPTSRLWTANGNAQIDTSESKFGGSSLLLDGTGDFLTTPHSAALDVGTGDFTIEAWVRLNALNKENTISNKRSTAGAGGHWFRVNASNVLTCNLFNATTPTLTGLDSATVFTTGVWYFVSACRVGNDFYLHVNGVLESSVNVAAACSSSGQEMAIGRDRFSTARDLNGWLGGYRFTVGVGRYGASSYAVPTSPFQTGGFPDVLSITPTAFSTDATEHLVDMPAVVDAGDLLICLFAKDGSGAIATPSGWNLITGNAAGGSVARGGAYYRISDGTEGGTSVDFVTSSTEQAAAQVYRIQAGSYLGTPEGTSTGGVGLTNTPNPPSLSPTWGSDDALVIAAYCADLGGAGNVSVYPYANGNTQTISLVGNAGRCECVSCWGVFSAGSIDPGTFTKSNNNQPVPITIAVRAA